jgi:hypothetical protein
MGVMYLGRLTPEQSDTEERWKHLARVPQDGDWSIEWAELYGRDAPVECLCVYSECGYVWPPIPIDELRSELAKIDLTTAPPSV